MSRFLLPETGEKCFAAFRDAFGARRWLAEQPRANLAMMLEALSGEIDAFNHFSISGRERFKTLEVLRNMVFTVGKESRRRFENKALPLLPAEQAIFEAAHRLWHACTVGYLHCLDACLTHEEGISGHATKVAHRALTSLRMEQLSCYWASSELDERFWRDLHGVYWSAEQLQALAEPVADALPKETAVSTVTGQYGMALLMHLADPFALSHNQLQTVTLWLARWRELVVVRTRPETRSRARALPLDLATPRGIHDGQLPPAEGRWLVLDGVLRKMRKRIESLHDGVSPESLKLGKAISAEASIDLLEKLSERLHFPSFNDPFGLADTEPVDVSADLEGIYRLVGGRSLQEDLTESSIHRFKVDQLAIFGHVVDPDAHLPQKVEIWRAEPSTGTQLSLRRDVGQEGKRLIFGSVLGVRVSPAARWRLAIVNRLSMREDWMSAGANVFDEEVSPLLMAVTEKGSNASSKHPALLLEGAGEGLQAILPAGLLARTNRCRFYNGIDPLPLELLPKILITRYGDSERWLLASA